MTRLLVAAAVAGFWWAWWPFPPPGGDPVVGLIALRSPRLHAAIRAWHYLAPAVALLMAWSIAVAVGRVWLPGLDGRRVAGTLPLHRMTPGRWVTLRDVYRSTLDPERIERKIAEVEALVEPLKTVRVQMADLAPHADGTELAA